MLRGSAPSDTDAVYSLGTGIPRGLGSGSFWGRRRGSHAGGLGVLAALVPAQCPRGPLSRPARVAPQLGDGSAQLAVVPLQRRNSALLRGDGVSAHRPAPRPAPGAPGALTSARPLSSLAFSLSRSFFRVPSAAVNLKFWVGDEPRPPAGAGSGLGDAELGAGRPLWGLPGFGVSKALGSSRLWDLPGFWVSKALGPPSLWGSPVLGPPTWLPGWPCARWPRPAAGGAPGAAGGAGPAPAAAPAAAPPARPPAPPPAAASPGSPPPPSPAPRSAARAGLVFGGTQKGRGQEGGRGVPGRVLPPPQVTFSRGRMA